MKVDTDESWGEFVQEVIDSTVGQEELEENDVEPFRKWMISRKKIGRAWDKTSWCHWYHVYSKLNDRKRNDDHMIAITANPGGGKTTMAQLIGCTVSGEAFTVDSFVYNSLDFTTRVDESAPSDTVVIDEGERLLLNTQGMTKEQGETVQTIMQMRFKNVLTLINIPSFWKLNEYVRSERVDSLVWLWHKNTDKKQVSFRIINLKRNNEEARLKMIDIRKRKSKLNVMDVRLAKYLYYDGYFQQRWPNFSEAEYVEHMKKVDWSKWVAQVKERQNGGVLPESKYYSVPEVRAMLGVSGQTVTKWIAEKKFSAFKVGRCWRIEKEEFNKFHDKNRGFTRESKEYSSVGGKDIILL